MDYDKTLLAATEPCTAGCFLCDTKPHACTPFGAGPYTQPPPVHQTPLPQLPDHPKKQVFVTLLNQAIALSDTMQKSKWVAEKYDQNLDTNRLQIALILHKIRENISIRSDYYMSIKDMEKKQIIAFLYLSLRELVQTQNETFSKSP